MSNDIPDPDGLFDEGSDVIDKLVEGFQREIGTNSGRGKDYLDMNQQLAQKALSAHLYFMDQLDDSPEAAKMDELKDMLSKVQSSEEERKERFED